ncbi:hypothetical protein RB653_004420 [Dictyostelium firmibasis]|uniref:Protein kinase domain-containing protein n=1 Tax=Dictyostelium firmibasis TaxID=79012 RepID=A0AAN7Z030_9MYCE
MEINNSNNNNNNTYTINGNNKNNYTHARIEHANHHDLPDSDSDTSSREDELVNSGNGKEPMEERKKSPSHISTAVSNERRESIIRELQQIKTATDYPSSANQYNLIEPIGEGTEGRVFKAYCIPLKENVAIKVVELDKMDPQFVKDVIKEVKVMNGNNHPNLIHYHTSFLENNQLWLVMDYLGGGSLADIMKFKYPDGIPEVLAVTVLKSLLKGLEYLHSHQRIHRDLKSDNILIGEDGAIELADFGVSAMFEKNTCCTRKTIVGTPCWMAPEIISERGYNQGVDIWSFGITAIELIKGKPPGYDLPPSKVFMNLLFGNSPSLQEEEDKGVCSHLYKDMVDKCLQKEPSKRPNASKLLEHKVFKQAKKNNYIVSHLLHGLTPCEDRYRESMSPALSNTPSPDNSRPSSPEHYNHGNLVNAPLPKIVKPSSLNKSSSSLELKNKNLSNPDLVNMPRAASHPVELNTLELNASTGSNSGNLSQSSDQHHKTSKKKHSPSGSIGDSHGSISPPLSTSPEKERKKGFFNHFRRHSIAKLFGSPKEGDHHHHHHKSDDHEQHHHFHLPWKHHHHSPSNNHVET